MCIRDRLAGAAAKGVLIDTRSYRGGRVTHVSLQRRELGGMIDTWPDIEELFNDYKSNGAGLASLGMRAHR